METVTKYDLLNFKELEIKMNEIITETAAVLQFSTNTTRTILQHFKWNSSMVLDRFCAASDVSEWLESMKIAAPNQVQVSNETFDLDCGICFESGEKLFGSAGCLHKYCQPCLSKYSSLEIEVGRNYEVVCPQPGCNALIEDYSIVDNVLELLLRLRCEQFVQCSSTMLWCPGATCTGIAVSLRNATEIEQMIECVCGHRFCFNCKEMPHEPLPCFLDEKWRGINTSRVDVSSATWITGNTKECPGCAMPVEKNGGCDHMNCASCHLKFNWTDAQVTNVSTYRSSRFKMAKEHYIRLKEVSPEFDKITSENNKIVKRCRDLLANTHVLCFFVRDYETEFMNATMLKLEREVSGLQDMLSRGIDETEALQNVLYHEQLLLIYVNGSKGDWNYNE